MEIYFVRLRLGPLQPHQVNKRFPENLLDWTQEERIGWWKV